MEIRDRDRDRDRDSLPIYAISCVEESRLHSLHASCHELHRSVLHSVSEQRHGGHDVLIEVHEQLLSQSSGEAADDLLFVKQTLLAPVKFIVPADVVVVVGVVVVLVEGTERER